MDSDDTPINRRRFFRAGLAELFKPLSKAMRPLEAMAHEIGKLEDPAPPAAPLIRRPQNTIAQSARTEPSESAQPPAPTDEHWVRPPGARDEQEFLETCSRCGECVRACPVHAIKLDLDAESGAGAPYIDTENQPCVMCADLACMYRCPTGAILAVTRDSIDMGTAAWIDYQCLNTMGSSCTTCVDACPVGATAIELIDNRIEVHEAGCTGCGVCHHACPTYPKSIVVTPKSLRDAPPPD
jgi:ferredoxin-type protein NapG